jgi:hypothetical protein
LRQPVFDHCVAAIAAPGNQYGTRDALCTEISDVAAAAGQGFRAFDDQPPHGAERHDGAAGWSGEGRRGNVARGTATGCRADCRNADR